MCACRYYLELNTKQRKEWEQRLEELKKTAEEEVGEGKAELKHGFPARA